MVYLFLAEGFEEIEALTPVDLLRRAGIEVTTVGIGTTDVCGAHGITVKADMSEAEAISKIDEGFEMVILPGGMPGTKNLDASPVVDSAISLTLEGGSYIAAICAAPMILGKRGILNGKRAVCYPGFEEYLSGAEVLTDVGVVQDGKIVTAAGMGVALEFGLLLVSIFKGEEFANTLRSQVIADRK